MSQASESHKLCDTIKPKQHYITISATTQKTYQQAVTRGLRSNARRSRSYFQEIFNKRQRYPVTSGLVSRTCPLITSNEVHRAGRQMDNRKSAEAYGRLTDHRSLQCGHLTHRKTFNHILLIKKTASQQWAFNSKSGVVVKVVASPSDIVQRVPVLTQDNIV